MVVVDNDLVLVPVETNRSSIADDGRPARRRAAPGVEVLGVHRVDARLVLDQRARRVVVTGIDGEAAPPIVWLDRPSHALSVEEIDWTLETFFLARAVDALEASGHVAAKHRLRL